MAMQVGGRVAGVDGGEDALDGLGLALGDGELLVAVGVGDAHDRLGLALRLDDVLLLDALRPQDAGGLLAFGLGDDRPPVPLGLHLTVHRLGDVGRRLDALDLDPDDPRPPLVGGVVEDLAELGVDDLAGGER